MGTVNRTTADDFDLACVELWTISAASLPVSGGMETRPKADDFGRRNPLGVIRVGLDDSGDLPFGPLNDGDDLHRSMKTTATTPTNKSSSDGNTHSHRKALDQTDPTNSN